MKNRKAFLFILGCVAPMCLTSCTWDSISRAQAIQILESILQYRTDSNFDISKSLPADKTVSMVCEKEYFDTQNFSNSKVFEHTEIAVSPFFGFEDPVLYYKNYKCVEQEYIVYTEEYHYIDSNYLYSKTRDSYSYEDVWNCFETTDHAEAETLLIAKRRELLNKIIGFIDTYDNITGYIYGLENISSSQITQESYSSSNYHSVAVDVTTIDVSIDNHKTKNNWYAFGYQDFLLHYFYSEDFSSLRRDKISFSINYDAYVGLPENGFVCQEGEKID